MAVKKTETTEDVVVVDEVAADRAPAAEVPVARASAVQPPPAPPAAVQPPPAPPTAVQPTVAQPTAVQPVVGQPEKVEVVDPLAPPAPVREVIVVDAPVAPRKKGNRGVGIALALGASVVYAALLVAAAIALSLVVGGGTAFVTDPQFYFPVLFFFLGLVLVTLVLNRAGWWSHIIGSVIVGLITWLGTASLVLVANGMFSMNQGEANAVFWAAAFSPSVIIAALLAREVAIWTGAILARRGRSLRVRNAEAHEAYEREQAELIPTV